MGSQTPVRFYMLNNPPDNWHFTEGSEFCDKIVNFGFYDIKKILARVWDRPDLPATFRPIVSFWNPKNCKNWPFLRNFKDFLCSKLDFGPKLFQIHYRWFSRASLDPKDVFYRFWDHFWKSKILNFVNFLSCYAVSYPNNHLICNVLLLTIFKYQN